MPNKCSVPGCSGRGGSGSGFQFPSDPDLRQRWIKAVNRDQLYKIRSSRKIDSRRLFSRECDFPETFSLRGHLYMTSALRGEGGLAQKKM